MSSGAQDAAARRLAWERSVEERLAVLQAGFARDMERLRLHEAQQDQVRERCGAELAAVIKDLGPLVDPRSGESSAALVAVFVRAVHELGALYGVQRPLRVPVVPPLPPEPAPVSVEESAVAVPVSVRREAVLGQLVTARERLGLPSAG